MKKYELTWFEKLLVKQLRKRPMTVAEMIVKTAYDGYVLRKIRKDAGVKKMRLDEGIMEALKKGKVEDANTA